MWRPSDVLVTWALRLYTSRSLCSGWLKHLHFPEVKNQFVLQRLQGMDPTNFTVPVSDTQLAKQIVNTMSVNVAERRLARILPAAGLVEHGTGHD